MNEVAAMHAISEYQAWVLHHHRPGNPIRDTLYHLLLQAIDDTALAVASPGKVHPSSGKTALALAKETQCLVDQYEAMLEGN